MQPTVFIQTNEQQLVGAKVAEYALKKMSCYCDKFKIELLHLRDYPALYQREGKPFLREDRSVIWRNRDLQSFTLLRFLPPQLMGYNGRAIVIDPDVFALADIYELLTRDMAGKAILCRKIVPDNGRSPYYASSVMLLDCSKLTHWQWEKQIEELFTFQRDYRPWISLLMEAEDSIGSLEEEWNHFDTLNETTKLLHNTARITQPWKTGLPIDFMPKHPVLPPAKKWGIVPQSWIARTKALIKGRAYHPCGTYIPHPDPNQEKFFFSLLQECLDQKIFTEDFIRSEIRRKHLRKDTLSILSKQSIQRLPCN